MKTIYRFVLAFALLLGVTGVATAQTSPLGAAEAGGGVRSVTLTTTGGFAGVHETVTVTDQTAYPKKDQLFALVTRADFRALKDRYLPANTCCDRFFYTLEVTYADGQYKKVETMDDANAPKVLFDVIQLLRSTR
ncbi:hypothetical protein LX15_003825 [Streptoalloteichus tenebrarius]|uniref:Secreted protein n=1 Tax=Streptoalloteichus tenebrarius (strain ATCC 17920 / DSM 40477 / JCM 4838 / CBS 697.72 / NBRC 16177 / NCIMB 11028 / NRRL B-12390 / A12253. 1 / ISP 5477) TaxID=1933 RepID=A0ABT1HX69_STRSD|nr:protealysin inhibitor emfourin [Streptoalloteichus tenebrarius]MCP2260114.1 hypothetical protein [Streptoalloteichus tenebrarius]BFF00563.1 hypothetical protein GCM10020241_22380 [Streptoalloteichus tenebrarius]